MPYANEHACRLRDPGDFQPDSFRRVGRKSDGKGYDVIMGRLKDKETMTEQAYRYPIGTWTEAEARGHCGEHDGIEFAPATGDGGRQMVQDVELRFVGSPRNPYGTHASKGYPGGRTAWIRAWTVYLSGVRDQGPIQGTIRRVSMIAAGMKPKCDLPEMSADDLEPRAGKCGPLDGKVYQSPKDYGLGSWKKPSEDDLDQEDIQLTCQDLEDIKRVCLREIAKRHACEEQKGRDAETERRVFQGPLEVREGQDGAVIAGYAAVFNQWSEDLGGFTERIEPGFFTPVLEQDVRALWQHDPSYVLGRTTNGTLRMAQDAIGLRVEIRPPESQWARDAMVSLRRGDVTGMSFGFQVAEDRWDNTERKRTLLRAAHLFDVSPVTFPAYPQTSVSVRQHVADLRAQAAIAGEDTPSEEVSDEGAQEEQTRAREALKLRIKLREMEV